MTIYTTMLYVISENINYSSIWLALHYLYKKIVGAFITPLLHFSYYCLLQQIDCKNQALFSSFKP